MKDPKRKNENCSLIEALKKRRTIREITGKKIGSSRLDQLVWAACGNTLKYEGVVFRTAPSAGATYPIELYAAINNTENYENGIYIYNKKTEKLDIVNNGAFLPEIQKMSWDQDFISLSNAIFLMVYDPKKIEKEYGVKSRDYALLECGHIAQNILLMAMAKGLGAVPVGAFSKKRLANLLNLKPDRKVLYMVCVGTID